MAPVAGSPFMPGNGSKKIVPRSKGLPSNETFPFKGCLIIPTSPPHPEIKRRAEKNISLLKNPMNPSSLKITRRITISNCPKPSPNCNINSVFDKSNRAIAEKNIDPTGMTTARTCIVGIIITANAGQIHRRFVMAIIRWAEIGMKRINIIRAGGIG